MILFPAIDLRNGLCVRLRQGDFTQATVYETDPLKVARQFAEAGAEWLHMVDLDGAMAGEARQIELITQVAKHAALKTQVGGGIRSPKTIEQLFNAGINRVVVGSLAVKNRALVQGWLREYGGDRIVLAFDIRYHDDQPEVLTHGWQSGSEQLLWDVFDAYAGSGLKTILCTDVGRDGMLEGANNALYKTIREKWPDIDVLASGGVSSLQDLIDLAHVGAAGAIIGKAIYEGRIDLGEALQTMKKVRYAG